MTWFKVDDQWLRHPKTQALSKDGKLLWLAGGLHCAAHLTDGVILKTSLRLIAAEADVKPTTVAELIAVGLWHEESDRYIVHQWLDYQPSREQVEGDRAKARERMKNKRSSSGEVPPNVPPNNGRSSASPTRPDQTSPSTSRSRTTDDDRDGAERSSSSEFETALINTARAMSLKSKRAEDPEGYAQGIARTMRSERGDEIASMLAEGMAPVEIAESICGSGALARKAARGPLGPKRELSYLDRSWGAA